MFVVIHKEKEGGIPWTHPAFEELRALWNATYG